MEIKPSDLKRGIIVLISLLTIGGSFFGGYYFGHNSKSPVEIVEVVQKNPTENLKTVDFSLFWDVWKRLEEKFVDKSQVNREKLVFGAIAGLVRALNDPYSEFLPPQETQQFQEDIKGSFGGIGAEIGIRRGMLTVIAPLKDSPAERAGVKAGDKILKVGDKATIDLTLSEAVKLIRGPVGTKVKLAILRDNSDSSKEIEITREVIKVPVLKTEKKADGIFIIRLFHFTENASFEFKKAVQEFFSSGSKKLILDLRNNPGGFLVVAVDIGSWFLPPGETVAIEKFGDGKEEIYRSSGYRLLESVPTVVLVNEGSASASEILAGALRDVKKVKIVGRKTFGKGSVQELINLPKNSSLKVTIAKWFTPARKEINNIGLEPDVVVESPKEVKPGEEEKDLIMEKGIEVLKGL